MSENIKAIAQRIKDLREISDFSIESAAKALNISTERYLEYESGDSDIPVSVLYDISHLFRVEMTDLLTGKHAHLTSYCVVRNGKGPAVNRRKEYSYQSLASNFKNKKFEPLYVTIEPKQSDDLPGLNSHDGQEFNYVIEGTIQVTIGNKKIVLEKGDSVFFDPNIPHNLVALNNAPCKLLVIIV